MTALLAANEPEDWTDDHNTPLVRAMAQLAMRVVKQIVVRSPIIAMLHETKRETEAGTVHEVIARTGLHMRAPFALIRRPRFPPERTDDPAAGGPPRRA